MRPGRLGGSRNSGRKKIEMKARNLRIWQRNQWVSCIDLKPSQLLIYNCHLVRRGVKNPTYFPLNTSREGLCFYWHHCWSWPILRIKERKNVNTFLMDGFNVKEKCRATNFSHYAAASTQLKYWHGMEDTLIGKHVVASHTNSRQDKSRNLHTDHIHMHSALLSSFSSLSLPSSDLPIHS